MEQEMKAALAGTGSPPLPSERQPIPAGTVIRRAARASKALLIRQALVYGVNLLGSVILARLLPPDQFGFYGIVLFAVAFLSIFGGTGFAANLIRTQEEPSTEDMRVVFTAQQLIVGLVFLALWLAAPFLASLYRMPEYGRWFFRMIGVSLVITSYMVMPQVRMERRLAFDQLAIVEVSQAIAFNVSAVFLAWLGWDALSFSAALMIRSATGALLANVYMSWPAGFMWRPQTLSRHLHFGVALQAGQFVAMLKDSISPLFVGMFLGAADVGFVTWASSLSAYALWILTPMQRLYLPFFARLQHDRAELSRVVSFVLWMTNLVAAPLTLVTLALARPITMLIFGQKWLVALPLYYLFCIGNLFVPCSTPLLAVLNALGQSRKTLGISVMWMAATWLLGVPCVLIFGLNGFGVAMIGVQLTNLVLFWLVKRVLPASLLASYWPSWPLACGIGLLLFLAQLVLPIHSLALLGGYALAAIIVYGAVLWLGYPQKILAVVRLLRSPA